MSDRRNPILVQPAPVAGALSHHMNTGIDGTNATLMVTSPSYSGDTLIRPVQYDFGEKVINSIHNAMDRSVDLSQMIYSKDATIAGAILPSGNGIEMNTKQIDEMWSFTLIIDIPRNNFGINADSGAGHRTIYTGYVMGEPCNSTGTENPDAIYIVTHMTKISIAESIGARGGVAKTMHITADQDIIPNVTQQYFKDDLCLLTPGDMHRATYVDSDILSGGCLGDISVSNNTDRGSVGVASKDSSPAHHMQGILSSIKHASDDVNYGVCSSIMDYNSVMPQIDFMNTLSSQLPSASMGSTMNPNLINGIDHTQPIFMDKLRSTYPHMRMIPIHRHREVQGEIRSQFTNNPQNIFSSMIASTVGAICGNLSICNVAFTYGSWIANLRNLGDNGMWEFQSFGTNIPQSEQENLKLINNFKVLTESALFNILKTQFGEFWISIQYSSIGDIIIDLQFNDFAEVNGLYVTNANLGGFSQAVMGNMGSFEHNSTYLNVLTNALSADLNVPGMDLIDNSELFASAHTSQDYIGRDQQHFDRGVYQTPVQHNPQPQQTHISRPLNNNSLGGTLLSSPLI